MTGSSQPNYFYLPYEFRSLHDHPDLSLAKGGSPPWQFLPSYPSPPMSSPPSPQRKVSDTQPRPATSFSELTLSGTTTSTSKSTAGSSSTKPSVSGTLITSAQQSTPQSFAAPPVARSSEVPRTYSTSSSESYPILRRTESASSASNVPDLQPTAGPSTVPPSPPNVGRGGKRTKSHVANACNNCKRAHLSCDVGRPCGRCVATGKADTCRDVPHKKRGRPRLRDESQFQLQQGGTETEVTRSPRMVASSSRPTARPGHRKTASLRTLAAFAAEQSHQPSPTFGTSTVTHGQQYTMDMNPSVGLGTSTRHPRLAPCPEVPIAFLDTDFVVLKANSTFQRLFSWLQEIKGMRLQDIAKPLEGDSFQNARNRLREERENREPAYLPPILQPRLDPVAGIGITDHDVEEVTRGFADHQFAWTFRLGGGIDQTLPVRMRLAKTSVYFVTLFLPPLPPHVTEQVFAPQPPSIMFPARGSVPHPVIFQANPSMIEQQPGISEPLLAHYTFSAGESIPQDNTRVRHHSFGEHLAAYAQTLHYQPQHTFQQPYQQPQQMLPPPPTLAQASDQSPGTANSSSSSTMAQPSFLPPPVQMRRPRSDTVDSLGRHIQTRLRADSGATVPTFQSSSIQQRHAIERADSEDNTEGGDPSGSPRKRRRLDINEMLQR